MKVTFQRVIAVLNKAGYKPAYANGARRARFNGFKVRVFESKYSGSYIEVAHLFSRYAFQNQSPEEREQVESEMLAKYAVALNEAGILAAVEGYKVGDAYRVNRVNVPMYQGEENVG